MEQENNAKNIFVKQYNFLKVYALILTFIVSYFIIHKAITFYTNYASKRENLINEAVNLQVKKIRIKKNVAKSLRYLLKTIFYSIAIYTATYIKNIQEITDKTRYIKGQIRLLIYIYMIHTIIQNITGFLGYIIRTQDIDIQQEKTGEYHEQFTYDTMQDRIIEKYESDVTRTIREVTQELIPDNIATQIIEHAGTDTYYKKLWPGEKIKRYIQQVERRIDRRNRERVWIHQLVGLLNSPAIRVLLQLCSWINPLSLIYDIIFEIIRSAAPSF